MPHGSILKRNKNFRVCFDFGLDQNDKRIRKYKTFRTKKDAELALSRHDVAMEDGNIVRPINITLSEWLDYWLNEMFTPRAAETSIYGNKLMIENHMKPAIGHVQLQKLTPHMLQQYYSLLRKKKHLSPNTIIKHHDMLNTSLKAAVKQEYILKNPVQGVDRPKKIHHEAKVYTPELLQKLISLCKGHRLECTIMLGAYLGLRREEICGLKWEDIQWNEKTIYIKRARTQVGSRIVEKDTKTYASTRKLFIPDDLLNTLQKELQKQEETRSQLKEYYKNTSHIIVMEDGAPIRPNYVSELFTKFLKQNYMPKIVLHELRHTFASISNEAGVQEFNIGKALGHSNVSTTKKIYTHLFDDKHTSAVNAVADMIEREEYSKSKQ